MVVRTTDISTQRDEAAPIEVGAGDLIVVVGNGNLSTHRVDKLELLIGRDPACDLAIEHPSLSRRHARLRLDGGMIVEDLGSTNGTRLGGQLLRGGPPVRVPDQAGFQIGPFVFVLVSRRRIAQISVSGRPQIRVTDPSVEGLPPLIHEFARTDINVLITGQTGVGKEVLATSLHRLSERQGQMIQLNCAALGESLLENELFGHERGAYTGAVSRSTGLIEAAAGGTLLLDEIGEMPLATQAKLLRVIERREVTRLGASRAVAVDVRFIAATNRDLAAEVAARRFREDLYFRLDGVTMYIPPLAERRGMIVPLALQFLTQLRDRDGVALTAEAVSALEEYAWPGNVRELRAVVSRALVLARGGSIGRRHLLLGRSPVARDQPVAAAPEPASDATASADRARVMAALEQCAGNQTRAAKLLGISRTTMITKLRIYDIPRPTRRRP